MEPVEQPGTVRDGVHGHIHRAEELRLLKLLNGMSRLRSAYCCARDSREVVANVTRETCAEFWSP